MRVQNDEVSVVRRGLNLLEKDQKNFEKALKSASNTCSSLNKGLWESRSVTERRHRSLAMMFISALRVRDIREDTPLRLKAGKVKALESDSAFKNLFGIGKAGRAQQAQALFDHSGGNTTLEKLDVAYQAAKQNDVAQAVGYLKEHGGELLGAIKKVAPFIVHPEKRSDGCQIIEARALKIQAKIENDVKRYIENAFVPKGVTGHIENDIGNSGLVKSFKESIESIEKTHSDMVDKESGVLKSRLREIDSAQREKIASARAASAKETLGPYHPLGNKVIEKLEKQLKGLQGDWKFDAVMTTSEGCSGINKLCRREVSKLDGRKIKGEIRKAHGDDTFSHGEKVHGESLEYYASSLTIEMVDKIASLNQQLKVDQYFHGDPIRVTYRQAAHSPDAIALWKSLVGTNRVLRPQQFMSTAVSGSDTQKYPVSPEARLGRMMVRFEITGFSGMRVDSRYRFVGEGPEFLYTHKTAFQVVAVDETDVPVCVKLTEVPASTAVLAAAPVLTL